MKKPVGPHRHSQLITLRGVPFHGHIQPSSHPRVLTYDFLQLVRLPGNWPAGCQRCLRVVDGSRRFALIRHDDDDSALVSSLSLSLPLSRSLSLSLSLSDRQTDTE